MIAATVKRLGNGIIHGLIVLWTVIVLGPVCYIVITSFRTLNGKWTTRFYHEVVHYGFLHLAENSIILSVSAIAGILLLGMAIAYPISRLRGRYSRLLLSLMLFGITIPVNAGLIPLYSLSLWLGLYNHLLAVILPSIAYALPLSTLIFSNFLRDIPKSLDESMRIEGAGTMRILRDLVIPLSRPVLATVAIYEFILIWNSFLFPLVLTQSPGVAVIPLGLWSFQGRHSINVPGVMAAVMFSVLPLLIAFVFGRRYIVRGLTSGMGK